ncbi:MAG: glycoside hydrolase family 2 [Planctomycetes bacterium]|nr:glycoside hydrolase family 2 [Planctomycetota bacterium]
MVPGDMVTRWAEAVSPTNVLPEYPRPMMRRDRWKNLNGLWEFAMRPVDQTQQPESFEDDILVPFCVESALSGLKRTVRNTDRLWYRRTFEVPAAWQPQRILLHFGAVDWEATVWINGHAATHHRGGYDPFSVDVTDMLTDAGPQEIVVSVWDPVDKGPQMRGKQVIEPHGFNYTGVSGIWQTVWIEPVSPSHIRSVVTEADIDHNCAWITVDTTHTHDAFTIEVTTRLPEVGEDKGSIPVTASARAGRRVRVALRDEPRTRLWSPDSPFLYDLQVTLKDRSGHVVDRVDSYFAMRKIAVGKDAAGINRLLLNNEPLFQYGFLDQGWWPDGLYTAPTDAALRYDIETAKRIGANMLRKHVKVEAPRFYMWCDRLGMLVWQDMPNGTNHTKEMQRQYEVELQRNIDALRGHPCIVMWVAFNEGWGQFDAPRHADWIRHYDPSRLVNHASGWADRGEFGHVRDIHIYPEPGVAPLLKDRAIVLGEFGGLGWNVKGHEWRADRGHGHGGVGDSPDLTDPYLRRIRLLQPMIRLGLSAACYTQIADQEIECNGVMTYDREVLKFDADQVAAETRMLYNTPPQVTTILPTSQVVPQTWRHTTARPSRDWHKPDFNDTEWKQGPGGFGDFHPTFPTLIVSPHTPWTSSDIWIRRTFELTSTDFVSPYFLIHHDEDTEVYVNGQRVLSLEHTSNFYTWYPLNDRMVGTLKIGTNQIAIHCHNEHHPQYIDLGLVDVIPHTEKP